VGRRLMAQIKLTPCAALIKAAGIALHGDTLGQARMSESIGISKQSFVVTGASRNGRHQPRASPAPAGGPTARARWQRNSTTSQERSCIHWKLTKLAALNNTVRV